MKILITGTSGFVGKHLTKKLSQNHHIVEYDLKNGQDILNRNLLLEKMQDVDLVIHLAAMISATDSWERPEEYFNTNTLGTLNVVRSAIDKGVKKIIFFSSAAVKAKPLTPYAVSKIAAEEIIKLYSGQIQALTIRPENIYGDGQKEAYGYVIHSFINRVKEKKDIQIYGTGIQARDFIHVDDVVDVVGKFVGVDFASSEIVSLGTGKMTKVKDLAKIIMKIMGKQVAIKFLPKRQEPLESVADTKALKRYGFRVKDFLSLEEGVKRLI